MSEIRATTISDSAGTGPITLTGQSAAKAWIKFDASGVTISDSDNISSVTDNGTGDMSLNFSSSMDSGNYSMTGTCGHTSTSTAPTSVRPAAAFTSTACRFNTLYASGSTNGKGDYTQTSNTIHGDLA